MKLSIKAEGTMNAKAAKIHRGHILGPICNVFTKLQYDTREYVYLKHFYTFWPV